jgi:hypothetical protein
MAYENACAPSGCEQLCAYLYRSDAALDFFAQRRSEGGVPPIVAHQESAVGAPAVARWFFLRSVAGNTSATAVRVC